MQPKSTKEHKSTTANGQTQYGADAYISEILDDTSHDRSKMICSLLFLCLFDKLRCMHTLTCDYRILSRRVPCTGSSSPYRAGLIPQAVPTFSVHLHGFFALNVFWIVKRDALQLSSVVELRFLDGCLSSLSCFSQSWKILARNDQALMLHELLSAALRTMYVRLEVFHSML